MQKRHGFQKSERIVSQKLIDELFKGGQSQSLVAFPLRAVWQLRQLPDAGAPSLPEGSAAQPAPAPAQLLISVSKRHFKHAVDRNRVKRQLREAYRLNKQLIVDRVPADRQLCLAFIWLADAHQSTADVERRLYGLLRRIAEKMNA